MSIKLKGLVSSIIMASILIFSGLVLVPSSNVYAQAADEDEVECVEGTYDMETGIKCAKGDDQVTTLFGVNGIFTTITNVILYILGAVSVIMLIYGGIIYTIYGGDSAQVTAAKNTIMYAIVGVVVAILAYAIINFVITSLAG